MDCSDLLRLFYKCGHSVTILRYSDKYERETLVEDWTKYQLHHFMIH